MYIYICTHLECLTNNILKWLKAMQSYIMQRFSGHIRDNQNFSAWCSGRREGFASDLSHWKLAIVCGLIITPSGTAFGIFNDCGFEWWLPHCHQITQIVRSEIIHTIVKGCQMLVTTTLRRFFCSFRDYWWWQRSISTAQEIRHHICKPLYPYKSQDWAWWERSVE